MKVLLVLALIAIIYSLYLSRNKTFIEKCKEEYKTRQEKITKRRKKRNFKSKRSSKRRKSKKRKRKRQIDNTWKRIVIYFHI